MKKNIGKIGTNIIRGNKERKMKMKIRKGTFETNSSSTHSIAISKEKVNIPKGTTIRFDIGKYGWEEDARSFPSYMYTALLYENDMESIEKLKSILDSWGVKYKFANPKWGHYNDYTYLDNGYVDHGDEAHSIMIEILNDEDLLARALFGDSTVYTGNDNSSEDNSMCYCAEKYNPNHIPDKYDYFFKGN